MEPTGCSIGGDLFALVWDSKTKKLYGLNASGRSPQSLTLDTLRAMGLKQIPSYGPLTVSVSGAVDGWTSLHNRFGSMPFKKIFEPTIDYAENGFPVTELIGYYLKSIDRFLVMGFPNIKETYLNPNSGSRPKNGERYKNPALAETYRIIAQKGRKGFYEDHVAQCISDFIQEQGGFLTLADMEEHHSEWVDPVSINYRGFDIWELPPNGQGITALQLLNILENKDFSTIQWGSEEYGIPNDAYCIGYIVRMTKQKDPFNTIRAIALSLNQNQGLHFLIAGDGELLEPSKELVRKLKITSHVSFLGFRTDIPELLSACDTFTLVSFAGRVADWDY